MEIEIKYDGKYPCLCMGHLEVTIDGKYYDFGNSSLHSGGSCGFSADWSESYINKGEWDITDFPKDFPNDDKLKQAVIDAVNRKIPWGCCGGCL